MSDLTHKIPVENPHDILKDTVIKPTGLSYQQCLDTLFINVEVGDRKPSELFRYIKQLLGSQKMDDSLLQHLWMQKLPSSVRAVLASFRKDPSISELTKAADRMFGMNSRSKISDFTSQFKEQFDYLTSHECCSQTHTHQNCSSSHHRPCRTYLINPIVGITSILVRKSVSVSPHVIPKSILRKMQTPIVMVAYSTLFVGLVPQGFLLIPVPR